MPSPNRKATYPPAWRLCNITFASSNISWETKARSTLNWWIRISRPRLSRRRPTSIPSYCWREQRILNLCCGRLELLVVQLNNSPPSWKPWERWEISDVLIYLSGLQKCNQQISAGWYLLCWRQSASSNDLVFGISSKQSRTGHSRSRLRNTRTRRTTATCSTDCDAWYYIVDPIRWLTIFQISSTAIPSRLHQSKSMTKKRI